MKGYKRLFLIDGDSFIYKALNGYVHHNVGVIMVEPGKEAVDNQIKGFLGNLVNQENRGCIFIISHDHGYYKLINRYRVKYGIPVEELDLKKSI